MSTQISAPAAVTDAIASYAADFGQFFADRGIGGTVTCHIAAATSADNPVWTASLDPNRRMFVGSSVKSFILGAYLRNDLSLFDKLPINDEIRSVSSTVYGDWEFGDNPKFTLDGETFASNALEGMISHSDNTATDAVLKAVGIDKVRAMVAEAGLSSVRIANSTRRFFTWLASRRDTDVSWQQLLDYVNDPPDRQPAVNGRQSMLGSAADMVRWYQLALLQPGFLDEADRAEFRRISATADGMWRTVPTHIAAYGKGGSIMWGNFGAIAVSGQMIVPTREPGLPGFMPITFSFEANWGAGDPETWNAAARVFQRTVRHVLKEALDSFYWTIASHSLTVEADVIAGTADRDVFSGPGGGADDLAGAGGLDTFEIRAAQTGRIDGGGDRDTVRAIDGAIDAGLVFRNVEILEATTASLAVTVAQLVQFDTVVPTAGGAAFTLLLQGAGGRLDLAPRYQSSLALAVDATAATSRVELLGTDRGDSLTGSAFDDELRGGRGDDTLAGGAGFDTANFASAAGRMRVDLAAGTAVGDGRDLLSGIEAAFGSAQADSLRGDDAANAFQGGGGDDQIWGRAGDDRLFGEAGADVLTGGLGADRLSGGAGPDTFVFNALAESTVAGDGRDRILDFDEAAGDRVDLRGIDAVAGVAGDQAFTFVGSDAFSGAAGELRTNLAGSTLLLSGDVNGDRVADFAIALDNAPTVTAAGLLL